MKKEVKKAFEMWLEVVKAINDNDMDEAKYANRLEVLNDEMAEIETELEEKGIYAEYNYIVQVALQTLEHIKVSKCAKTFGDKRGIFLLAEYYRRGLFDVDALLQILNDTNA